MKGFLRSVGPARAGMIRTEINQQHLGHGWPRTSGDDPGADKTAEEEVELAPHERG